MASSAIQRATSTPITHLEAQLAELRADRCRRATASTMLWSTPLISPTTTTELDYPSSSAPNRRANHHDTDPAESVQIKMIVHCRSQLDYHSMPLTSVALRRASDPRNCSWKPRRSWSQPEGEIYCVKIYDPLRSPRG